MKLLCSGSSLQLTQCSRVCSLPTCRAHACRVNSALPTGYQQGQNRLQALKACCSRRHRVLVGSCRVNTTLKGLVDEQASTTRDGRCAAASLEASAVQERSLTQVMYDRMQEFADINSEAGGAGGSPTYQALQKADEGWTKLRTQKGTAGAAPPEFVKEVQTAMPSPPQYDVVVSGGTLGIFLATALQVKGLRVAVVERGRLQGRAQEWNISRKELETLVEMEVMTAEEVEACINMEFNPVRAGFHGTPDIWTRDVLNLGVSPAAAIAKARERFEEAGGQLFEQTQSQGVTVHSNGVTLEVGGQSAAPITGKLLVDAMGHFSPIVRQVRWGQRPDGVCLVVGACCRGFDEETNATGDLIYTNTDTRTANDGVVANCQLFWEAFPAGSGPTDRTTYLFTYLDADKRRPSLAALMEEYWRLMPQYQGVRLDDLTPLRILFGMFPTYRSSPLAPAFDRILQIGDASGIQSPLSFGGFGALLRHLPRLTLALTQAVQADIFDRESLAMVNAYNPGLSGAWMLQRAMSVRADAQSLDPKFINKLLGNNFAVMQQLGDPVLKPLLQDVVQFRPLGLTMLGQMLRDPFFVPQILKRVGLFPFLDWLLHFIGLGWYSFLYALSKRAQPLFADQMSPEQQYRWQRRIEAWQYGSGNDFRL